MIGVLQRRAFDYPDDDDAFVFLAQVNDFFDTAQLLVDGRDQFIDRGQVGFHVLLDGIQANFHRFSLAAIANCIKYSSIPTSGLFSSTDRANSSRARRSSVALLTGIAPTVASIKSNPR